MVQTIPVACVHISSVISLHIKPKHPTLTGVMARAKSERATAMSRGIQCAMGNEMGGLSWEDSVDRFARIHMHILLIFIILPNIDDIIVDIVGI